MSRAVHRLLAAVVAAGLLAACQSTPGPDDGATRQLLRTCDGLKRQFRQSGERSYLDGYWNARRQIRYRAPHG